MIKSNSVGSLLCPRPGALSDDAAWRLSRTSGRRAACVAGRLDGTYWLIRPGSAAARFYCRPGRGHIVSVVGLQLVFHCNCCMKLLPVWDICPHYERKSVLGDANTAGWL